MRQEELRCGNYFLNSAGEITEVTSVDDAGVNGYYDEGIGGMNYEFGGEFEDIEAIPVTEETLTTLFNFFKLQDPPDWCKERDAEMYSLIDTTFYVVQTNCEEFIVESTRDNFKTLQGIHHLQNFYFVNNYEELQPKDVKKYPFL